MHTTEHGEKRLARPRLRLQRTARAVECARDQRTLAGDEGAHAGVQLGQLARWAARTGRRHGTSRERCELGAELVRPRGVAIVPVAGAAYQLAESVDGLTNLLGDRGIPRAASVAYRLGHRLEARGRLRDRGLLRQQRRPTQRPRDAHQLVARWTAAGAEQRLEIIEALSGFEGEEVGRSQGLGHEGEKSLGNGRRRRYGAPARAVSTSRRISRTATVIPPSTARLTTLCPMFSSSMSAIAATGATLR